MKRLSGILEIVCFFLVLILFSGGMMACGVVTEQDPYLVNEGIPDGWMPQLMFEDTLYISDPRFSFCEHPEQLKPIGTVTSRVKENNKPTENNQINTDRVGSIIYGIEDDPCIYLAQDETTSDTRYLRFVPKDRWGEYL